MEMDTTPLMKIINEMNGYKIGTKASLFTNFLGEKKNLVINLHYIKVQKKKILQELNFF